MTNPPFRDQGLVDFRQPYWRFSTNPRGSAATRRAAHSSPSLARRNPLHA
jgi:hypothetical protein